MEKILPINSKPYMHTYTHHGYFHAITSSDDKVCTDEKGTVADIKVQDFDVYDWTIDNEKLQYSITENKHIIFRADKWNQGMNMSFYRECQYNDMLRLTIYKQLYSNAWSNISIFITRKGTLKLTRQSSCDVTFGNFSKDGIYYSIEKGLHNRLRYTSKKDITIEMEVEDNNVFIKYCDDDCSSDRILISRLEGDSRDYYIGFIVNLGNSIYYEWMFSNYIQIYADTTAIMPIDFVVNWHKDWSVHTANHLIDYAGIEQKDVKRLNVSLLDFIKKKIDMNNYIEIELNDNMKWNIPDEKYGKYFHQNLIYGYSDEKECLYVLYYNKGNLAQTQITYSDFESDRNSKDYRMIYMLRYNPCYEKFCLSIKRLLQIFSEYQSGDNISYYDNFYDDTMLGINAYKLFCSNEFSNLITDDLRVPHLLYERTICNIDRIKYLYDSGVFTELEYEELLAILKVEERALLLARNIVLRNRIKGEKTLDRLQEYMNEALCKDIDFTKNIIKYLSNCIISRQTVI